MHLNPQLIDRLVLTLAHFVWQGCLLAICAWVVVEALGVRSVHKRYAMALGLLIACIVLPCATFAIVEPGERPAAPITATLADTFAIGADEPALIVVENHDADALPIIIPGPSSDAVSFPADIVAFKEGSDAHWQFDGTIPTSAAQPPPLTWLQRNGHWFVLAWTCGVGALALRLILATVSATVLRWRGWPVDTNWQAEIDRLVRRMNLHRAPTARLSRMVGQVCVVGLYRPVILFPASWVSGVPADVLEAVIAHELAHIRRHDVWVIHLQRLVETLLFFHPAVWWISRQVSRHRELCCDADAAAALNSPVKYATALEYVALKEYSGSQTLFMATLGGKKMELLERIRTVLGAEPTRPRRWQGSLAACLALAGIMTAVASLTLPGLTTSQADDESAAIEAAAEEDEEPADTTSRPDSQPAPIGLETNIVTSAEPDEVRDEFDPADTPQVIERLRSVGITFEPVFEGSERHRIGGYMGLEFSSSEEFSRITRDFHQLLDAKLLDDVIVSEEPEVSLAVFKMGQWHQRRLEAELGYLPDELDVVGFHPHPHLRRFVVHDGAFEFITPRSQCTPEELAAIGAECTTLPIESSFHYDKQLDGVTWRVHGFREKPWLIVVEDVSPRATAVAAVDDAASEGSVHTTGNEQVVITYAVGEFLIPVAGGHGEATQESIDALTRLIRTQVPAESWVDGEEPRIVFHTETRSLIIAQDHETHARIRQFLEDLHLLLGNGREVTEIVESSTPVQANTLELPIISPQGEETSVDDENRDFIAQFVDESQLKPQPQPATPGELALANALNEITSIEADNSRLSEVMQMIVEQHGINISVNEVALNEIGKTSDEPISVTIEGITLRSALNIICEPLGIGYEIDGEVLLITSRQRLEGELTVCTYSVADIVQDEGSDPTPEEVTQRLRRLRDAVPLVVEPGSWSEVGGQGSMQAYPPTLSLIVRQTPAVHRQLASLLEVLRGGRRTVVLMMKPGEVLCQKYPVRLVRVTGHRPNVVQVTATSTSEISITGVETGRTSLVVTDELGQSRQIDIVVSENDADAAALLNVEEQIERALDRRIDLRVRQVPLNEALDMVSEQLGINIVVDESGLNENGFTATEKVSLSLRNIPAKTVLELLLNQLWLDFVIQDEVVLVTNHARLQGRLNAVPYDVSDIIGDAEDAAEADLEELAVLLRSTVAPESWQMVGGQGSIIVIPWRKTLVVTQSPARHEAVEAVLASLRRAKQPVE